MNVIDHIQQTVNDPRLLTKCLTLSVVTIAIFCTFWTDMVFEKGCDKLKVKIGEFYAKPICGCYVCGTFWYGILQCLIYDWTWYLALPAMGISAIISQLSKE